jgi:hypothetical protein
MAVYAQGMVQFRTYYPNTSPAVNARVGMLAPGSWQFLGYADGVTALAGLAAVAWICSRPRAIRGKGL